jgi:hypothetical protein
VVGNGLTVVVVDEPAQAVTRVRAHRHLRLPGFRQARRRDDTRAIGTDPLIERGDHEVGQVIDRRPGSAGRHDRLQPGLLLDVQRRQGAIQLECMRQRVVGGHVCPGDPETGARHPDRIENTLLHLGDVVVA